MYPLIRLITTAIRASNSGPVEVDEECESSFRCRPWDLDMFMEMNNGRVLTLYDLGRFHLAIRTGLSTTLKANGWGLVVAGSTVRYRQRIKMFDKVTMRTRVVAVDERWFYIVQSMWLADNPASSVLLRTGVTGKGKVIPSNTVMQAMNIANLQLQPSGWVKAWIDSEEFRPWPPD